LKVILFVLSTSDDVVVVNMTVPPFALKVPLFTKFPLRESAGLNDLVNVSPEPIVKFPLMVIVGWYVPLSTVTLPAPPSVRLLFTVIV